MTYKRGTNPNSLANLEKGKFKKGQVANPKGRPPKELSLTNIAWEELDKVCPYDPEGRTWGQYLVARWLASSLENIGYFKELIERLEGRVLQPVQANIDRTLNIFVIDEETKDLVERVGRGERTLPGDWGSAGAEPAP